MRKNYFLFFVCLIISLTVKLFAENPKQNIINNEVNRNKRNVEVLAAEVNDLKDSTAYISDTLFYYLRKDTDVNMVGYKLTADTLEVKTYVGHTVVYETTVIQIDSMTVNGNIKVNAEISANNVVADSISVNNLFSNGRDISNIITDTAEWNKISGKPDLISDTQFHITRTLYVDKNNTNDYIATGSINKPFKTIQSAINKICELNTSDYYCIVISTGVYNENIVLEDLCLQRLKLQGVGNLYINPTSGLALSSTQNNNNLKSLYLENIIFPKSVSVIAENTGSSAFEDVIWNNVYFTENAVLTVSSINSITLKNCYSEQTNIFNFSNISWVSLRNSQFQNTLNIENTLTKNISSWGIYNSQFHAYSTYQAGTVNYIADTKQEIVLNGCRWGWQNTTVPDSITVYAHNSYLRGNITNQGTVYLRNSQCQSITGGNIVYQNFDYQIKNTSNKNGNTIKDVFDNLTTDTAEWSKINNTPNLFYADSSIMFSKVIGDTVEKTYVDNEIEKINNEAENLSLQVFANSINNKIDVENEYPKISDFNSVIHNVSDEVELVNAISAANNYDVINLTSDITLTSTLNINKTLKFTGNYKLINSTNTTMLSITADSVYLTSEITIEHKVVSSVSAAINVNAKNFVSEATVNFYEFGYILRGSFNISGNLNYIGDTANSHRHIGIYRIDEPSILNNITFDFQMIPATSAYANLIFVSWAVAGDSIDANLKVSNCFQKNKEYVNRQFIMFEVLGKSANGHPSLWVENCVFNSLNGDIGFIFSGTQDLSFFDYIVLLNNNAGNAANMILNNDYKGLLYLTGGDAGRDIGYTNFYSFGNVRPLTGRTSYKDVIDSRLICYNSSNFGSANTLIRQENLQKNNSIYNYTHDIPSKNTIDYELNKKLNISDSIVITKISELENDSNFISLPDLPDTSYIDNHIDSADIHFTQENISISQIQINDSIPYTRVSSVPDFALRAELGIDTASADIRYLSVNADTMNADWNKTINKPFIPDTSAYTYTTVLNDSFNIKADTPHIHTILDIINLSESLTVKLSNTDTSIIRDMAGTVNYETEVAEIYKAMVNISDTKLREVGDSVAILDSSILILSDSITLLENRVNAVEDSIPNRVSQLQNDSDFASYNDTLFFQVSNTDTIYSDTSITADTQMDIINDTACLVIYGDSYGIDLSDFDFSYKMDDNGYWVESSQLVYQDIVNNRIIFKADINTFPINTIRFTIYRGAK